MHKPFETAHVRRFPMTISDKASEYSVFQFSVEPDIVVWDHDVQRYGARSEIWYNEDGEMLNKEVSF